MDLNAEQIECTIAGGTIRLENEIDDKTTRISTCHPSSQLHASTTTLHQTTSSTISQPQFMDKTSMCKLLN